MSPATEVVTVDPTGLFQLMALFTGLFTVSFFFSGTETAFFGLQTVDRQRFGTGTRTQRHVVEMLDQRTPLIATILMGNEIANVAITATTAAILAILIEAETTWLTVLVLPPLMILFAEVTPKIIAFRYATKWTVIAAWPLTAFYWVAFLPRLAVTHIVMRLARLFRVVATPDEEGIAEEEFMALVEQAGATGDLDAAERDFIEAVLEFDEITVGRLMSPSPDLRAVPVDIGWKELLEAVTLTGFSRIPVYEDRPGNIVGVLLVRDLLRYRLEPFTSAAALRRLLIEPVFVPASKPADDMLSEFLAQKLHMAFVVDEHGTLRGLVTLDDLLGALVGEDLQNDDITGIERRPEGLIVRGAMDLEALQEETGLALPEGQYHTVGGFVFHTLGRLAEPGDRVDLEEIQLEVTAVDGRRITGVRIITDRPIERVITEAESGFPDNPASDTVM